MKIQTLFFIISLFIFVNYSIASSDTTNVEQGSTYHRDYTLLYSPNYDMLNSVENSRTAAKLLMDAFYRGLGSKIENKTIHNVSGFLWSFAVTWSSTMWPHEFGHKLRALQFGGDFHIEKVTFPVAFGAFDFPEDVSARDELLAIIGGIEANSMITRNIQLDHYRNNGLYNDELYVSFFNKLIYPTYALLLMIDPSDPEVWLDNGDETCFGDFACFARFIWEMDGKDIFLDDATINPDFVSFYHQAGIIGLLWTVADLNFYRGAKAIAAGELNGQRPKYLIGNNTNGWAYGTMFNISVLGSEMYLNNYFRLNKGFYSAYIKYGFPFKNNGIGISAHDIIDFPNFKADINIDLWQQKFFGNGFSATTNFYLSLNEKFDIIAQTGWKSEGYLIGRPVDEGFIGFAGLRYNLFRSGQ